MLLLIHVTLALLTLIISTLSLFAPSLQKIKLTYALTTATLLSAGGLVVFNNASIGRTCMTAVVYLAVVFINVFITKKKLAKENASE
jgi:hypothetical protein